MTILISMGPAILWNSYVLKSTQIAVFNITPSVPVSYGILTPGSIFIHGILTPLIEN